MTANELLDFEDEVSRRFDNKEINGPVHLCSPSQAEPLIEIFNSIKPTDWVLSTWRGHWHALLKGVPREQVMSKILNGRSMMLHFPEYRFMSSAIVGGMLPIACGLAAGGEKVHCFVGDMASTTGGFHDAIKFVKGNALPVRFIIEDNGLSTNTPTEAAWGTKDSPLNLLHYKYRRTTTHYGTGIYVPF